jgi:uncharacterized protein
MQLDLPLIVGLVLIGIIAGGLSGLIGIGGGVIMVPALVMILGFTQHQAQGTSLAVLCIPVAIAAAMHYYNEGHIDLKIVGLIAVGFVVGGYLGGKFAVDLPQDTLRKLFAVILLLLSLRMFFAK